MIDSDEFDDYAHDANVSCCESKQWRLPYFFQDKNNDLRLSMQQIKQAKWFHTIVNHLKTS